MLRTLAAVIALLSLSAVGAAETAPPSAVIVVDDFESYKSGEVVGSSASGSPWQRFGKATNDNVVATALATKIIKGKRSGQYGMVWPAPFGAVQRVLDQPANLREQAAIVVTIRSELAETKTKTTVRIGDGETTYEHTQPIALTAEATTIRFAIDKAGFKRTAGKASFEDVFAAATRIGLTFTSENQDARETIVFDDLHLVPR